MSTLSQCNIALDWVCFRVCVRVCEGRGVIMYGYRYRYGGIYVTGTGTSDADPGTTFFANSKPDLDPS